MKAAFCLVIGILPLLVAADPQYPQCKAGTSPASCPSTAPAMRRRAMPTQEQNGRSRKRVEGIWSHTSSIAANGGLLR